MSSADPNSMEQAQLLYGALTGSPMRLTATADQLLTALRAGEQPILVELPWGEVREGERHERHQVLLTRLEERRIHFVNALKSGEPAGTEISGPDRGPERRIEANGEESMDLVRFIALFASGGKAMLKG